MLRNKPQVPQVFLRYPDVFLIVPDVYLILPAVFPRFIAVNHRRCNLRIRGIYMGAFLIFFGFKIPFRKLTEHNNINSQWSKLLIIRNLSVVKLNDSVKFSGVFRMILFFVYVCGCYGKG